MPIFTATAKNRMLDAMDESATTGIGTLALYSAYSAAGTTNELTGGTPAYARKPATFNAAAGGTKALAATVTFDVPAGATVAWVGGWSTEATPVFLSIMPAGAGPLKPFAMDDATADTLKVAGHGYVANQTVVVWPGNQTLPAPLAEGTIYYVVNPTANNFQLATTSGGAAINLTAVGNGYVQSLVVESFAGQGQYQVTAYTLDAGVL
jgi:hypothetical protein